LIGTVAVNKRPRQCSSALQGCLALSDTVARLLKQQRRDLLGILNRGQAEWHNSLNAQYLKGAILKRLRALFASGVETALAMTTLKHSITL
jgi:hypothetical protein